MAYPIRHLLTQFGVWTANPLSFAVLGIYVFIWITFNRQSFDWHAIATVATWLMTLFIQRAEHRDTQAIHAKLDELLRAEGRARNVLTRVDDKEPEEIEEHRNQENAVEGSKR
jgi:low affinity Fe/Cu permease